MFWEENDGGCEKFANDNTIFIVITEKNVNYYSFDFHNEIQGTT